jgi:hypothetical protein
MQTSPVKSLPPFSRHPASGARERLLYRLKSRHRRVNTPAVSNDRRSTALRERRTLVVSILIAAMTGVAIQEMATAVGAELHERRLEFLTLCLAVVFFLTSVRFFIGATLHLISPFMATASGGIWLLDLSVILIEFTLLIFLGGLSSASVQSQSSVTFVWMLLALLVLDIIWVAGQWIVGRASSGLRRPSIPWPWARTNALAVGAMGVAELLDSRAGVGLGILVAANVVAFVLDIRADAYHVLRREGN